MLLRVSTYAHYFYGGLACACPRPSAIPRRDHLHVREHRQQQRVCPNTYSAYVHRQQQVMVYVENKHLSLDSTQHDTLSPYLLSHVR